MAALDDFLSIGSGSGAGSGSGSGYGYGDGSGYGYGSGSGIKSINGLPVQLIDDVQTFITHVRGNVAKGSILNSDLTTTPCYVVKGQNVFAHGSTLHDAMDALYDKMFNNMPVEQRVQEFLKVFEAGKTYPNKLFFDWHHRLTGSCMAGRESFARDHGIDVDNGSMTVADFIKLTKGSYGGSVIKAVAVAYGAAQ